METPDELPTPRTIALDSEAPAWWQEALGDEKVKKTRCPQWLNPTALPEIVVGSHRVTEGQMLEILRQLQLAKLPTPPPLIAALKQHADRASLDAFAWEIFESWQRQGYPSKDKWAMAAVGFLGGDGSALKLTPNIRAWPGESAHQRAGLGIECLRAIGSDTALSQLSSIAQKLKSNSLGRKAIVCMDAIAAERGMSKAELEDHIVPDCGLDVDGKRVFDYGPRRFIFALSKDLKPMVRDEAGKLKSNLPKPGTKDDAALAEAALEAWNILKKILRDVLRTQAIRLERALVTGRRWSRDRFETLLVRHPLMTHLARRLVWGVYEGADNLAAAFRITDERDYADVKDQPFDLGRAEKIGIVHPAHLSPAEAGAWGELFSEYEILAPFLQLGRPVNHLEPGEAAKTTITRYGDFQLDGMIFMAILDRQGWTRGEGGHIMSFPGPGVTAVVETTGDYQQMRFVQCYFIPDQQEAGETTALKLGEVHPVIVSEVIRYLNALRAAAK